MDIKTAVLTILLSIALRLIANKALAKAAARWPVLHGLLPQGHPEENSMLKINFSETPAEEKWILHGRLTDPWVHEFRACWKKKHHRDMGRACIVDLNEVTFIDKCGERLLRMLARGGAQFTANGIYTKQILEQITANLGNRRTAPKM